MFEHGDFALFQLYPGDWVTGRVYALKGKDRIVLTYNGDFHERPINELKPV
jgi:hypothetical protein